MRQRICHIGVGRFHRAHQAVYLHELNVGLKPAQKQPDPREQWGICGIGLRAADRPVIDALRASGHCYSVCEVDGSSVRATTVESIVETIDASESWDAAIAVMSDSATKIISFTITEAGYVEQPRSAIELATRALAARRDAGRGGITLMSCDNLIENGHRLRDAVLRCAERIDATLARWIEKECAFPCSMVDRITPAEDPALLARLRIADRNAIVCEPWRQWILEDHFVAGRPALERVGVVISDDVKAYEDMKVSLLNGGHSAIAHLGLLLGHERVDEAMRDPIVAGFLARYMREVAEVVRAPAGVSLDDYQASLAKRFSNAALGDRLQRLALDTGKKLEQALLPPLRERDRRGLASPCMTLAVALWLFNQPQSSWVRLQSDAVESHLHALRTHGVAAYVGQLAST